MSKKEIVLSESMVQRIMELAGNKAFYNKNLITESTKKNKKVVSEANLPPTDDMEPELDLDTESPVDTSTSPVEPSTESVPSVEDSALSDVGVEDSAPTMDTEMFLDELSDALMTHFGISLPVGHETGIETGVEEVDDEEPILDDEDSYEDESSDESESVEDTTSSEPPKPPVTESKKLSPITQAIYEQLINKLKNKVGKTMNESAKLKFAPKLNEAKNGQPKAPPHVNKTPKGNPGKPAKQSPKPTKKG